ncbi:GEM-like protein 4 [Typha latifolia]|uniref:GEM-like protein 4 n=1 Tax=Typha latifolia TaxID=4733 RepID=UPI003C2EA3C3
MESLSHDLAIGIPVSSATSYLDPSPYGSFDSKQNNKKRSFVDWVSKLSKRTDNYVQGIREHVTLGTKFSETVKGKLRLSARILHAGGVDRDFRLAFSVEKGEKLLKAFQCYLSTTAGPIAGMLFISTAKIAFHSDKPLALTSPKGDMARVPYKVLIPIGRVKSATPSENVNKPNQKYVQIITVDGFEFWFMGFVSYQTSFKHLKQAISD